MVKRLKRSRSGGSGRSGVREGARGLRIRQNRHRRLLIPVGIAGRSTAVRHADVLSAIDVRFEGFLTVRTHVRPYFRMDTHMTFQGSVGRELGPTY